MAHTAPSATPGSRSEARKDARNRGWRSLAQGALVSVLVGAALAVAELVKAEGVPTLIVLGSTAATGAAMAFVAWAQRRLEDVRARRGGEGR